MKNAIINHKNGNPRKNNLVYIEVFTIDELFGENSGINFEEVTEEEKWELFQNRITDDKNIIHEDIDHE